MVENERNFECVCFECVYVSVWVCVCDCVCMFVCVCVCVWEVSTGVCVCGWVCVFVYVWEVRVCVSVKCLWVWTVSVSGSVCVYTLHTHIHSLNRIHHLIKPLQTWRRHCSFECGCYQLWLICHRRMRNDSIVILIHFLHVYSEGGVNSGNKFCCEESEFRYSEKMPGYIDVE